MSTLKLSQIQNLAGVQQYLCKAWVNFNGTGTVAIYSSGNVSSITDRGTGGWAANFTVAMTDNKYAWAGSFDNTANQSGVFLAQDMNKTTTACDFGVVKPGTAWYDTDRISFIVFGN